MTDKRDEKKLFTAKRWTEPIKFVIMSEGKKKDETKDKKSKK